MGLPAGSLLWNGQWTIEPVVRTPAIFRDDQLRALFMAFASSLGTQKNLYCQQTRNLPCMDTGTDLPVRIDQLAFL